MGIPQDAILGPLLFLVYVNYFPSAIKRYLILYADDTTAFGLARTFDSLRGEIYNVLMEMRRWFN